MRALLALLIVWPLAVGASEPDLGEMHIRSVVDENAKTNGICEVHHARMERHSVPVTFGLLPVSPDYFDAMKRDFPHCSLHIDGGCVTSVKFLHARLPWYVCPECKRAEQKWAEKYRETNEAKAILSGKDATRPDVSG
jgi:hypothetical protein